nr:HD domain-containing protein [Lachnospiraceae bacterium]
PDAIINKTSFLTPEEYDIVKGHSVIGYEILSEMPEMKDIGTGARWHHERYDGTGYPDGLKEDGIPLPARIIAVADAYDAMTSNRSYRRYMSQEVVRQELEKGRGKQFDPGIADIMLEIMDEDTDYELREL